MQGSGKQGDEIDSIIREAEQRLKSSELFRGARISTLPAIILLGEPGSGKTTTMLKSGLEAEALAGQATQANSVAPTEWANLWFARQMIFVEAGNRLLAEPQLWARLVRRIAPAKLASVVGRKAQAPRAAIVCVDCETFAKAASGEAIIASARNLGARLSEISQLLGITFPVYVLFSKADRIKFFDEYARNLNKTETGQVFGATLPFQPEGSDRIYADEETKRVSSAFDGLSSSLSDKRIEFLSREYGADKWPGIYEFPREFRKLKTSMVQFLVELCRPSQLRLGPFLRGFYFTGRRTVVISSGASLVSGSLPPTTAMGLLDEPVGATRAFEIKKPKRPPLAEVLDETPVGATKVFEVRKPTTQGAQLGGTNAGETLITGGTSAGEAIRQEQQTVFLSHLFTGVLLQDSAALAASGSSSQVSFWQSVLLLTAAAFFLVCMMGFFISYTGNRALESAVRAAQAASFTEPPANQAPSMADLNRLNDIRQLLDTLSGYHRNGAPLSLRWGLYTGDELYPPACQAYARGLHTLLMGPTQGAMAASLRGLVYYSATDPYSDPYDTLKAYLITTTEGGHAKDDATFLSSKLVARWPAARSADQDAADLAKQQFVFYSTQLSQVQGAEIATCLSTPIDDLAVQRARAYLLRFPPEQAVYQAVLADDKKKTNSQAVDFNGAYPGSSKVVVAGHIVPAAFTKEGWAWMQKLSNLHPYLKGESWVLGPQAQTPPDAQTLMRDIHKLYQQDFISEWQRFLKESKFVPYHGDELSKLTMVTAGNSPLLTLFCVVAQNTLVDDSDIQRIFQTAQSVVPPDCDRSVTGAQNKDYTEGLFSLQGCWRSFNSAPSNQKEAARQICSTSAGAAEQAANNLATAGRGSDSDQDLNKQVQTLLRAPIVPLQNRLQSTGGANDLCAVLRVLGSEFPFNHNQAAEATLQEFQQIFRSGGLLGQHPPLPAKRDSGYRGFYSRAEGIQRALYPDGNSLQLHYTITPLESSGVKDFTLTIGNQSVTAAGGPKQFVWRGDAKETVQLTVPGLPPAEEQGPFGIFAFVARNEENGQLSGQEYTFAIPAAVGRPTANSPRVRLSIGAGAATRLFQDGSIAHLGCTSTGSH